MVKGMRIPTVVLTATVKRQSVGAYVAIRQAAAATGAS
jgi:hypothetical protein